MKSAAHHQGLSEQQVLENRTKYGVNILTPPVKEPLWKQFLEKFSDPIIKILLVALLLSVGVACYQFFTGAEPASVFLEPVGILVAILLATCVGFAFEVSANKKFEILNQVNDETMVQVIRGGNICELPRRDVVVGDIVILNTGEEVPADGVLLEAVSLQVNESTLTGEPLIGKTTNEAEFKKDATYPSNHVLKGTTVADGHGIMEVTSVGDRTEYGKVYEGSQIDNKVQTPLNRQLSRLGDLITWASYAIAALIIIGRLTLYFSHLPGPVEWLSAGTYILNTVMIAVTVIVVTVPEGLPMSVTLSLALASLPPDERVMQDPPRKTTDHIITRPMGRNILGVGILFVAFLFGLLQYFKHADVTSLTQFSLSGYFGSYLDFSSPEHELTGYELSLFFTIFVLLQFWNMFNAKAFNTHQSAFARMGASIGGFGVVALLILAGQYLIVTFGGKMFNVVPLSWTDWGIIFAGTSLVLWIGELVRAFTPDKSSARP